MENLKRRNRKVYHEGRVQKRKLLPHVMKLKKNAKRFINDAAKTLSPYTVDAKSHPGKRLSMVTKLQSGKRLRERGDTPVTNDSSKLRERDQTEKAGDLSDQSDRDSVVSSRNVPFEFNCDSDASAADSSDFNSMFESESNDESCFMNENTEPRQLSFLLPKSTETFEQRQTTDNSEDSDSDSGSETGSRDEYEADIRAMQTTSYFAAEKANSLSIYECPDKGNVVVVANHPSIFTFHGRAMIFSISGAINILGYTLSRPGESVYAYSSDKYFNIQVRTEYADKTDSCSWTKSMSALRKHVSEECLTRVINACNVTSVIILFRKQHLSSAVDFVCAHIPNIFPKHKKGLIDNHIKGFQISHDEENIIEINKYHIAIAGVIESAIRVSGTNEKADIPRIMVYGRRDSGKSTCLRYFINRVLSMYKKVYYLDSDPGQTEFTPPGCVSLTEVKHPLLGPPFTHLKRQEKLAFYGDVQLLNYKHFTSCIDKVVNHYKENFSDQILFINTMGWIQDLGKQALDYIRQAVSPNIEIELVNSLEIPPHLDPLEFANSIEVHEKLHFQMPENKIYRNRYALKANARRDLAVLAYFGRCQAYFKTTIPLNAIEPFCIQMKDVLLHSMNPVNYPHLLQAVNGQFAALCFVDDSKILLPDDEKGVERLVPGADFGECFGFGIIRAVDLEKKLIYVITPESHSLLNSVNTLVIGNVPLPKPIVEQQVIYNQPVPYVKFYCGKKNDLSHKINKLIMPNIPSPLN